MSNLYLLWKRAKNYNNNVNVFKNIKQHRGCVNETYLSLASAALSLCRLFLNQLLTCVVVSPVASASSRFSRGDG